MSDDQIIHLRFIFCSLHSSMANLPELATSPAGLEVDHTVSGLHHVPPRYASKDEYPLIDDAEHARRTSPKICGIKRSTFFLAVILGAIIIAASVGGGVGGSIAVSNARYASIFPRSSPKAFAILGLSIVVLLS